MAHVLYIIATPQSTEDSFTLKTSQAFVEAYKAANPEDTVEVLDLYKTDIDFLSASDIENMANENKESKPRTMAKKFAAADKFIFAAPMWNFSTPAILKAYIDCIVVRGITFNYTSDGANGLLKGQGKKAILINARGGDYSKGSPYHSMDLTGTDLKTVLGFIGIEDFKLIPIDGTAMGPEKSQHSLEQALQTAKKIAISW